MVTRKRTKPGVRNGGPTGARRGSSSKLKNLLNVGDWLDVLDLDGVWNVARVLSVPSPGEVEITYDGWPKDFDEVVRIDSDRVAPYHTFTKTVKCWVKYLNWPLWPSLITIRTPGTPEGVRNLMAEHRLHVDFFDNAIFTKRDRCWQKKGQARAFENNYDAKRMASTGEQFERSLGWVLQSDASTTMPKFAVGTLPIKYKNGETECVETVRGKMGDELWFQSFAGNRMRHRLCHVYETTDDEEEEEEDSSSDDTVPTKPTEKIFDLSARKETPIILQATKRPPPVKIELHPHSEPEVPYELDPIDSSGSDDSDSSDSQEGNQSKRRRLQTRPRSNLSTKAKSGQKERRIPRPQARKASGRHISPQTEKLHKRKDSIASFVDSAELDRSLLVSAGKSDSSDVSVDSSGLTSTTVSTNDTSEKGSQELRGRFCMMQAAEKEASPAVEAKEKAKGSRKTIIAVPRKFDEEATARKPFNSTNAMLHMAPPPRLRLVKQSVGNGVALASPSTAVFSSSNGFSMESWFKRKLVADFIAEQVCKLHTLRIKPDDEV
ncbi:hypothetical protein PF005_g9658 [Phytophthora fragariae]|uniref:PWWP domain-containing protein n=1 Tax=Phytophthora fragariae TaxID=53985 RepID=A0A6A3ZM19_9STRA|nr:hypothetical protein PF009_g10629 [Phytophthora fragariae]KAE9013685.1 hypothetical protein PF011_g8375 [Phytophthora fragariae]KAE9115975.1 hypothetical protein PF007_g9829 [Phytophthora fragariae]KAE9146612.1 hypothetical protein PF006_g8623 [Phytophthora fragariae]KAE9214862.1 hypothetical protein PF005_g9658 [Phytophthora fragariae]